MDNFVPLITVAGTALPDPSTYNGTSSTVVDSARNTEGIVIGAVVRDDIAKVEATWRFLSVADWAKICGLFKISAGGSFINSVTFFDQTTGEYTTRQMYKSDLTSSAFLRDPDTGVLRGWTNCRLALTEV